MFYPPHLLLLTLREEYIGIALSWLLVAHAFVALATLGTALEQAGHLGGVGERSGRRTRLELGRWLGVGVWVIVCTAGLTAIQLLPTLEAAGESSRAAVVGTEAILEGGLRVV